MAGINRYTQLTPSQFNPLSLEEILSIPMYKQQQHDQLQKSADELGLFDIKNLQVDSPIVQETMDKYKKSLDDYIEELNSNGFNATSRSKLRDLNRQKQELLSQQGILGKAQLAYNSYQQNLEQQRKLYEKGDISADKFQRGMQNALANYTGIANNGVYNSFTGVKDSDFIEQARKIASDIQKNPISIEKLLPLKRRDGMYIDIKTGDKYTPEDAIKLAVKNTLLSDNNIVSDLKQREQLGLLGNYSAEDVINNVANTLDATYSRNEHSVDRSIRTDPYALEDYKRKIEEDKLSGNYDFEKLPAQEIKADNAETIQILDGILNNKSKSDNGGSLNPYTMQYYKGAEPKFSKITLNDLNNYQYKRYMQILNGLKETTDIGDINPESPEAIKAVKDFLNNTSNIDYQNKLIKDGVVKTYGNNSIGVQASNGRKIAEDIIMNADKRYFYSVKDNKLYTKDQMIDKGYLHDDFNEDLKNAYSTGYYDPENYLADVFGDDNTGRLFTSPYELKLGEDTFLVSRSAGEVESNSYKADEDYNRIYRNTTRLPNIPYTYSLPDSQYKVKIAYIPYEDKYVVNQLDENGNNTENSKVVERKELKDWLHKKYGVNK